jgi:hypothetical protein
MVIAITDEGFYKSIKKNIGGVENESKRDNWDSWSWTRKIN